MKISGRLFYTLSNGEIVKVVSERRQNVTETTLQEDFPEYDESIHGVLQLPFGDGRLNNVGSYYVDVKTKELVTFPKIYAEVVDETTVVNADITILTWVFDNEYVGNVTFTVGGTIAEIPLQIVEYPYEVFNSEIMAYETEIDYRNQAFLTFNSALVGTFEIQASCGKFGTNSVNIEVVDNA